MKPEFGLVKSGFNTSYAPLCVLGQAIKEREQLKALEQCELNRIKTCEHSPGDKLMDAFLVILSGCPSLYMLNTKLQPDPMLAKAWQRERFADQSVVSRMLDACGDEELEILRKISCNFWQQHTQLTNHDWRKRLIVDLDLTALKASRNAEDSTTGYVGKKTRQGVN